MEGLQGTPSGSSQRCQRTRRQPCHLDAYQVKGGGTGTSPPPVVGGVRVVHTPHRLPGGRGRRAKSGPGERPRAADFWTQPGPSQEEVQQEEEGLHITVEVSSDEEGEEMREAQLQQLGGDRGMAEGGVGGKEEQEDQRMATEELGRGEADNAMRAALQEELADLVGEGQAEQEAVIQEEPGEMDQEAGVQDDGASPERDTHSQEIGRSITRWTAAAEGQGQNREAMRAAWRDEVANLTGEGRVNVEQEVEQEAGRRRRPGPVGQVGMVEAPGSPSAWRRQG